MAASNQNENLVFDYRTLRLIVGAIALAFPFVVVAIVGDITSSISASYHTTAGNVFVGFLFIIGALLVGYNGYFQRARKGEAKSFWKWLLQFQEDVLSTIGGLAAFFTALFPTTCDRCDPTWVGTVHYGGAIVLVSVVVYFCQVAFLRRLNEKLLRYEEIQQSQDLGSVIHAIQSATGLGRRLRNFLFRQPLIFLAITREVARQKGLPAAVAGGAGTKAVLSKTKDVVFGHGKKLARGSV